ncbi:MAG: hypothetical protein ABI760_03395 [Ferruginibacter sp.]
MKSKWLGVPLIIVICVFIFGCAASKVGSAYKDESLAMKIKENSNVVNPDKLITQQIPTIQERALAARGEGRGLLAPLGGDLVSLASTAMKQIIANNKKKYGAIYQFGLTDLYFYDQLSEEGPFDPAGMQFSGFKLVRTFLSGAGTTDTALVADFTIDTTNILEVINNSVFRLRVKSFDLRYAKAKVDKGPEQKLNMDVEISFLSSYVSDDGKINERVNLGKFYLLLRDMPLDRNEAGYASYYASLTDSLLTGKSFIVPRSSGHYRNVIGEMKQAYSRGAYSIEVKVKESSKSNFVTRMLFESAGIIINVSGAGLKSKLSKKL